MLGEIAKLWDPDHHVGVSSLERLIELYAQPPNSPPDTNILDLGPAHQSCHSVSLLDPFSQNSGDIIKMVEQIYKDYPWQKVDRIFFVTLQSSIFDSIIIIVSLTSVCSIGLYVMPMTLSTTGHDKFWVPFGHGLL
jgi:hypothetical protein